ncbi:MAG: hypothetical protein NXI21_17665 [Alphaproteobacteria bacterium]|nr:hypothetical protein [Alphaproteobacteria bacterium]
MQDPPSFVFDGRHGKGVKLIHRCEGDGGKTSRFTYTPAFARQRKSADNRTILTGLANGTGFNDIIRIITAARGRGISVQRLYDRIFWMERVLLAYEQAQLFEWRRRTEVGSAAKRHVIAHDTLDLLVNWETSEDTRNTVVQAHASADVESGFIFRLDCTFDGDVDPLKFFEEKISPRGGVRLSKIYRQKSGRTFRRPLMSFQRPTARFHEHLFYASALHQIAIFREREVRTIVDPDRRAHLMEMANRKYARVRRIYREYYNIKRSERDYRSPFQGAIISSVYSLAAHFAALREELGPGDYTLYTDANGTLVRFLPLIFRREIELDKFRWIVTHLPEKNLSKGERGQRVNQYRKRFRDWFRSKGLTGRMLDHRKAFIADAMVEEKSISTSFGGPGYASARWFSSPVSTFYEPAKIVGIAMGPKWFRDYAKREGDVLDILPASSPSAHERMEERRLRAFVSGALDTATLQPVDTFFNSIRARLSPTDRSSHGGGSMSGTYIQGNLFNPRVLVALLNIYRVHYNFLELRQFETDTIEKAEAMESAPMRRRMARVPWSDERVEAFSPQRAKIVKLTPAMRHGIHQVRPGEEPKAPDIIHVLSQPWEVYGTRLYEKLTEKRTDLRRRQKQSTQGAVNHPENTPHYVGDDR